MRLLLFAITALSALIVPAAVAAQHVAATAPQDARALAELIAPRSTMVALNIEWARRAMDELPRLNDDSRALEAEYPGVHAAMWAAVEPEIGRQIDASIPRLWDQLERIYRAELTADELAAVLAFYRSPKGRELIAAMYGEADLQPMIESMALSEDGMVSAGSMDKVHRETVAKVVETTSIEEADVLPLLDVVSAEKLQAVGAKVQAATQAWVNEDDPGVQEVIDRLMVEAAERFMQQHEAGAQ